MKSSERKLAVMSAVIVAVAGGLIMGQKLSAWDHDLSRRKHAADLERLEADSLLSNAPAWRARGAWLDAHQPVASSNLEAENELLDKLMGQAKANKLVVVNHQYQESVETAAFQQFGLSLTVKGSLPEVFQWICDMQSPEKFLVVPLLKITPDKDDPAKIVCAVQFWRWYQPATQTPAG